MSKMTQQEFHDAICEFIKENCPEGTITMFGCESEHSYNCFMGGPGVDITDDRYLSLMLCISGQLARNHFERGEEERGRAWGEDAAGEELERGNLEWPFPVSGKKH